MLDDDERGEWDENDACREWSDERAAGGSDIEPGTAGIDICESRFWRVSCWECKRRYFWSASARSGSFCEGLLARDMVWRRAQYQGVKSSWYKVI